MWGFMNLVKIPVTKALSLRFEDFIGELKIKEEDAEQLASMSASGLDIKLETGIEQKNGKWSLRIVSFGLVPAESSST